ncbi:MAG: DUF2975 domain-containing protein [Paludibacteraceae bacterium]|nr:DUF2975 domain-containing protein [Paludibacteraceae bacterium]
MKHFKILCTLLIFVFFASLAWSIANDILTVEHAHGSWEAPLRTLNWRHHTSISIDSKEPVREMNLISGDTLYVIDNNVTIYEYSNELFKVSGLLKALEITLDIVMWLVVVLFIYLIVQFVKIIRSFTRSKVFERQVVRRLSRIGIVFIVMSIIGTLWNIGKTYLVSQLIDIDRFDILYRTTIEWDSLIMGLIILVMNEIVKQALVMKEENDLTI